MILFNAIAGIAAIIATWLLYAALMIGLGSWYLRAFCRTRTTIDDIITSFWVGLATLLALLQFWHFALPINFTAHLILTSLAALGFLTLLPRLFNLLKSLPRKPLLTPLIPLALTAIWLANRATGPGAEYDSGLYHIGAVRWAEQFAIVPGLANLHMRFGFSSTIELLAALMDHGLWAGYANHLVNGFLLIALAATIIRSTLRILSARGTTPDWLLVFSGILIIDWGIDIQASSYSTDIGVVTLTLAAAYYFLRCFADRERLAPTALACTILASAAVTAKASAIVLSAPMVAVILVLLWRTQSSHRLRALIPCLIAGALFILPWLARQTILTGYPFYPSEFLAFNVDWKMPFEKVRWLRRIMLDFDRWESYDDTRHTIAWIPKWLEQRIVTEWMMWKMLVPCIIAMVAINVAAIRRLLLKNKPRQPSTGVLWLFACTLLAAIVWFASAPDPRYASQLFVLMMASALLLAFGSSLLGPHALDAKRLLLAAALFAAGPLFIGTREAQRYTHRTLAGAWILPPTTGLFYPTPQTQITKLTTATGLEVYVPVPAPGTTFEDRVWDAPLPSAPRSEIEVQEVPIPDLRLRQPPDLQKGFMRVAP